MYPGHNQYRFVFRSSFAGRVHYEVQGDGKHYTIELVTVHAIDEYWRRRYNGTEEDWNLNEVALVNTIRRHHAYKEDPLAPAVVDAFNAWRVAERQMWLDKMKADREKYGPWEKIEQDPYWQIPKPVRAVHYFTERGTKCRESWKCPRHCPCWHGFASTWPLAPFPAETPVPLAPTA